MIWDVVILFASGVSATIIWIVSKITLALPQQFLDWLAYAFGYANVFKGIIAIPDLMSAVIVVLAAMALRQVISLFFRFVWPLIPYFGSRPIEPFSRHVLDLSGQTPTPKGRIDKRMKF